MFVYLVEAAGYICDLHHVLSLWKCICYSFCEMHFMISIMLHKSQWGLPFAWQSTQEHKTWNKPAAPANLLTSLSLCNKNAEGESAFSFVWIIIFWLHPENVWEIICMFVVWCRCSVREKAFSWHSSRCTGPSQNFTSTFEWCFSCTWFGFEGLLCFSE